MKTPRSESLIVAFALVALTGCDSGEDLSKYERETTLSALQKSQRVEVSLGLSTDDDVHYRAAVGFDSSSFRPPECPVIKTLRGTLDAVALEVHVGEADSQEGLFGGSDIVCQPPSLGSQVGGELDKKLIIPGEHVLKLDDGTAEVERRFALSLEPNEVEVVTPKSRRVRPGDEVMLAISPLRAGGEAYSLYMNIPKDADGISQRSVPVQLANDAMTFVVPDYAMPGDTRFEVYIDRWGQPEATTCLGASVCTIQVDGKDAPEETVMVELTIEP